MADIDIDWNAGNPAYSHALDAVNQGYLGAEKGYELGQKRATIGALQGIDLDNPGTIDSALGKLVRANASEQANALLGLNVSRQLNKLVMPALAQRLQGAPGAPASTAGGQPDGAAPTSSAPNNGRQSPEVPGGSPLFGGNPEVEAHYHETMGQAEQAVETLKRLPLDQRPAAAAQIREQFVGRGIPAGAIDGHMDDLSDEGLAKTGQYFADQGRFVQNPSAGPAPTHPTGWAWANQAMNDGLLNDPIVAGFLKAHDIDIGPTMERAERLIAPWNTEAASTAYAGPKEEAKKAADLAFSIPEAVVAARQAGMVASAETAARAPGEFVTVNGPNGQPVYVRKDFAMGYAAAHGGVLGQGIAPAEQQFRTDQAGQAADILKPDPVTRNAAADTQANAERALSIIAGLKLNPATPIKAQIAQGLRAAGFAGDVDKFSNDVAGYQQATTTALAQGAHAVFPQRTTDRDIRLMQEVYPTLKTPNDAAAVAMGTLAAQAHRTQQFEDFKANYSGPHDSPNAIQKEWLKGPGGSSILQSPEWSKVSIGGRPAFNPATDVKTVKGVKVGAWGIGTGHPVYFVYHGEQ